MALLTMLIVVMTSQGQAIINNTQKSVISSLENQNKVIELTKVQTQGFRPQQDNTESTSYTPSDINKI